MARIITENDVEQLEYRSYQKGAEGHRAAADQLTAWSELGRELHGENVSAAGLMVAAAEQFGLVEEHDLALALLRRAVDAEGDVPPDPRAYLLNGLLEAGFDDEAHALADLLRAERPADPDVYTFVGESFEAVEDYSRAQRWFAMGLRLFDDPSLDLSDMDYRAMVIGRWRVRQAAGISEDVLDAEAVERLNNVLPRL